MKKVLTILMIISISLTLLLFALENSAYSLNYYMGAFEKNNTVAETGKTMDELKEISMALIDYLKGKGGDELLVPHFNDREVSHMEDVQILFDYGRVLKYISGSIALATFAYFLIKDSKASLGKRLFYGLFSNHIILILMAFIIAADFTKYWTVFHHIFFTNDLWLLNPETDLMIQMLPEPFFIGIIIKMVLSFFAYLSIIQIWGLYYMMKGRGKWNGTKEEKKSWKKEE